MRRLKNQLDELEEKLKPQVELKISVPKWLIKLRDKPNEPKQAKDESIEAELPKRKFFCPSCKSLGQELFTLNGRQFQCKNNDCRMLFFSEN
jgi:hypothetical protein